MNVIPNLNEPTILISTLALDLHRTDESIIHLRLLIVNHLFISVVLLLNSVKCIGYILIIRLCSYYPFRILDKRHSHHVILDLRV